MLTNAHIIDVESYCRHTEISTQPYYFKEDALPYNADHPVVFNGLEIKVLDEFAIEYYLTLKILMQITQRVQGTS